MDIACSISSGSQPPYFERGAGCADKKARFETAHRATHRMVMGEQAHVHMRMGLRWEEGR